MKYLNLSVEVMKSPEFGACDYDQIGVWLILSSYCATVENGGVIKGAKSWGVRQWITAGLSKDDVKNCSLFEFKGNDLHIFHYPIEQEAALKAKREAGKKGGRPPKNKGEKPHGLQNDNHMVSKEDNVIVKEGNSKGNVMEYKGKEETPSASGELFDNPEQLKPEPKSKKDIIEEIYQAYPKKVGKAQAIKSIEKAIKVINPEDLLKIVETYANKISWEEKKFIPNPSTWFNQGRWEDDQSTWDKPSFNQQPRVNPNCI